MYKFVQVLWSPPAWVVIGLSSWLFTVTFIGYLVFDFSAAGVSHLIGGLIGVFLVCFLVGFLANGRNLSRTLFGACLIISCISEFHANFPEILDAIELKKGREIFKDAHDLNSILHISEKNTENKYVKFVYDILKLKMEQKAKLDKFFNEIAVDGADCIKSVEKYDLQKLRECQGHFANKAHEQRLALKNFDLLLQDIETNENNMISQFKKENLWQSAGTMRSIENDFKSAQKFARSRVEKLMQGLIEYTEALNMFFSYLNSIEGKVQMTNKKIVFNDPVALEKYNNLQNKLVLAAKNFTAVAADNQKNQELKLLNVLR